MKPIPQISANQRHSRRDSRAPRDHRSFLFADYFYQSAAEAAGSSLPIPKKGHGIPELRMFRKLSSEFFGAETSRDYVAELGLFILTAGVSAWSIISMIAALSRM